MPPRGTVTCEPETGRLNGRVEGQQALRRDNGMITSGSRMHHAPKLAGKGNVVPISAGEIPWRTSRRLQEATLRLIKERDGGYTHNQATVKDDFRITETMPPARSHKRPQGESEPTGEKQEDHSAELPAEESGNLYVAETEETSSAAETRTTSLRVPGKVKRKKVHFNDPVHLVINDENKAIGSVSSDAHDKDVPNHVSSPPETTCNRIAGGKVDPTIAGSEIPTKAIMKQPKSCFDLLCSQVSRRGWRCYRSRDAGQAFCVYHRRDSTSVAGICLYT